MAFWSTLSINLSLQEVWLLCVYLFKNCPSQFFSHCESAEPVFCSKELSSLPFKNQNKSLALSYLVGKFKFAVLLRSYTQAFLPLGQL